MSVTENVTTTGTELTKEKKYGKEQLLSSSQFTREEKYFLSVLLAKGRHYSINEASKLLEKEMKRKVK